MFARDTITRRGFARGLMRALAMLLLCIVPRDAIAETTSLVLEWGGGGERLWHGEIRLSVGALSHPRPLGLEADEPGSMWLEDGRVMIRTPSPRVYDGVDVTVESPPDAIVTIELAADDDRQRFEFRLGELGAEAVSRPLDAYGNRLVVRRGPDSDIALTLRKPSLVFAPGERFKLDVTARHPLGAVKPVLHGELSATGGSNVVWNTDSDLHPATDGMSQPVPLDITLPDEEGVYDLRLEIVEREDTNLLRIAERLGRKTSLGKRHVQLVVIAPKRPFADRRPPATFEKLSEIDPAHPAWWQRLPTLPVHLPWAASFGRGPLGSGTMTTRQVTDRGRMVELGNVDDSEVAWQAYPLSVARTGQPHVVEIAYAADIEQSLGLSIVEPNATGAVLPIGLDSGVYVSPSEIETSAGTTKVHRLVFWPRTETPLLLVHNGRVGARCLYGKITLLGPKAGNALTAISREQPLESRLEPAFDPDEPLSDRMFAAYFDRPLFPENFSAPQAVDAISGTSGRTLRDWKTFHTGATRMVEYLHHVGYNAAIVSVVADGSAIYPSRLLEPTPRYDDGAFFTSGQDPVRKDVLEMLLRVCDRERVQIIPALEFAAPLPKLEALLRDEHGDKAGIELVGADGRTWTETHPSRAGLVPRYNPLDPRVQQAMLDVVRELAERYGPHVSFGGVALQLSSNGYAQLPGVECPMDDATLTRFAHDVDIQDWPQDKDQRAARVELVLGKHRAVWLSWRAEQLAKFYARVQAEVDGWHRGTRLYLVGADALIGRELADSLAPGLPRTTNVEELLSHVGLDPQRYREPGRVVLLRPHRLGANHALAAHGGDLEVSQSVELDKLFADAEFPASLFFHEPHEMHLPSFDEKSPFQPTYTRLVTESSPSAAENRRRFAHALATFDSQALVDGGWLLPLGQEQALKEFIAVYRRLPARKFETLAGSPQPVVVRTYADRFRRYVYLVNDSPWPIETTLKVEGRPGTQFEALSSSLAAPTFESESQLWKIHLEPYGLVAGVFTGAEVVLSDPQVTLPPEVDRILEARIHDLWQRVAALKNPVENVVLANPDFEQSMSRDGSIVGWQVEDVAGGEARIERGSSKFGGQSLRLRSGPTGVQFRSEPLPVPETGRLSVSLWMRTSDAARQPTVRVALTATDADADFVRYATLGEGEDSQKLSDTWSQYVLQVRDLPIERISRLRVQVELVGVGEVWIDGVRLYDLDFSESERLELSKTVTLAQYKRTNGELADCARLLDSYWPRFLMAHVSPEGELASRPRPIPLAPNSAREPQRTGMFERVRGMVPNFLR